MLYAFMFLMGLAAGVVCVFLLLADKRKRLNEQKRRQDSQVRTTQEALRAAKTQRAELDQKAARLQFEEEELSRRVISYTELQQENALLKRDLQGVDVDLRKLQLDRQLQGQNQEMLDQRATDLGGRYLKENVKWVGSSLTPTNFVSCKQRLQKVIERCRGIGFDVSAEEENGVLADLRAEYEKIVRAAFEREEQARIRAQIREEQRLEKEIERELKQLDRERTAIQAALDKALAEAEDEHSEEVERLKARLAEAEEKSRRAISRAQMTKSGHVYVISNIGSFGEGVYKIGMTRRLEPTDRVRELSSASVPFPFDVHMMISCDDAPALENSLHRELHKLRVNKINPRKEFFKTDVETVRQIVEASHGEVQYVADPEALQYRQSLDVSEEDYAYIESVYSAVDEEHQDVPDDE